MLCKMVGKFAGPDCVTGGFGRGFLKWLRQWWEEEKTRERRMNSFVTDDEIYRLGSEGSGAWATNDPAAEFTGQFLSPSHLIEMAVSLSSQHYTKYINPHTHTHTHTLWWIGWWYRTAGQPSYIALVEERCCWMISRGHLRLVIIDNNNPVAAIHLCTDKRLPIYKLDFETPNSIDIWVSYSATFELFLCWIERHG